MEILQKLCMIVGAYIIARYVGSLIWRYYGFAFVCKFFGFIHSQRNGQKDLYISGFAPEPNAQPVYAQKK